MNEINKNFRQWYDYKIDENGNKLPTFFKESVITFSQCSADDKMTLYEVLKFMSDTATEDYNQRGLSFKFLKEKKITILASRLSFHIIRLPENGENVTLKTWEETPEKLQLIRRYKLMDENNNILITSNSAWIIVNLETRRIIKTADYDLRPEPKYKEPYDGIPAGKIIIPKEAKLLDERKIYFSDVDGNGHTNNSRYGAFMLDCLPDEYQTKNWTDFRINFSKEAVKGQTISMFGHFDEEQKQITIAGKSEDTICFEAELHYS